MNETTQSQAQGTQHLSFFVGEEEYGIGILEAREIIQYPVLTHVPAMPRSIRGIMNLRGSVVPVVDLAVLFDLPERPVTKRTCVVVVEGGRTRERATGLVGIVIDAISQVVELGPDAVEPSPSFGTRIARRYVRGLGKRGPAFVLLLDLERILEAVERDRLAAIGAADSERAGAIDDAPDAAAPEDEEAGDNGESEVNDE